MIKDNKINKAQKKFKKAELQMRNLKNKNTIKLEKNEIKQKGKSEKKKIEKNQKNAPDVMKRHISCQTIQIILQQGLGKFTLCLSCAIFVIFTLC